MLKWDFLISFVIILIVSVTPASASLTSELNAKTFSIIPKNEINHGPDVSNNDLQLKKINEDIQSLQSYSYSLKDDTDYIKTRSCDYGWKVWNWPSITLNLIKSIYNLMVTTKELLFSANKLKSDVDGLECDDSYYTRERTPEEDAEFMATELSKMMNTTITVKKVKADDVKIGDIVQYMSQGKYPRYLEVVGIKKADNDSNNNTGRKLLDYTTPMDVNCFFLKGTGDKTVEEICIGEYTELGPCSPVSGKSVLQKSVELQQKSIDQKLKATEKEKYTTQSLSGVYKTFFGVAICLSGVAGVLAAVAFCTTPLPPVSAPIWMVAGTLAGVAGLLGIIGGILYGVSKSYEDSFDELVSQAKLNEKNIANYTKLEDKPVINMEVSTFEGIPIVKHPLIDNWKDLQAIIVEKPKYGDLLMGPGLQFLYGPHEGYTGEDTFKYNIIHNGQVIGSVQVKVIVKPIPLFKMAEERGL